MSGGALIKDMLPGDKPRERLAEKGSDALSDAELIAILLRVGTKGRSAVAVAGDLVKEFQSLEQLARASWTDLAKIKGIGRDKAVALKAAFTLAQRMAKELAKESPLLDCPESVANLLREENRLYEVEQFQVALLNTRRRLIQVEKVSQGTLDSLLVHPREVFRSAISANASALILVHNHPSGDPAPSEADIRVTRDLIRAGQLLKIEVLDHIILGRCSTERTKDFVSLKELGHFYS